jgi:hypothetical protein
MRAATRFGEFFPAQDLPVGGLGHHVGQGSHLDRRDAEGALPARPRPETASSYEGEIGPRLVGWQHMQRPRMAQVLTSWRLTRARLTAPGWGSICRTATASSAEDATCAWTPPSLRTTSTTLTFPGGSRSWRRIRQANT